MKNKKNKSAKLKPVNTQDTASFNVEDTENSYNRDLKLARALDPVLIVIRGPNQGQKISLKNDKIIIGRGTDAHIHFDDQATSKHHAILKKVEKDYYIQDLKSTNGVYINREKIEGSVKLSKEDMISVGANILKYLPAGELEIMYIGMLEQAAHMDKLTEIYNQNYIDEVFNAEFKRARALKSPLSLIMFDVDKFKIVNDNFGHPTGDFLLKTVTQIIKDDVLLEGDIFGRKGGDEFVIILTHHSLKSTLSIAERIRKAIENHIFKFQKKAFQISLSLGVTVMHRHTMGPSEMYKAVDLALYKSKNNGRNLVSAAIGRPHIVALKKDFKFNLETKTVLIQDSKNGDKWYVDEWTGEVKDRRGRPYKKAS